MHSASELEAIVARHLAAMNQHDAGAVVALYADDGRWAEPPGASELRGRGLLHHYLALLFRAFPDLSIVGLRSLLSTDAAVVEWHAEGTHRGAYLGISGTGLQIDVRGASILDIRDGKVQVSHHYCDSGAVLRQLRVVPQGEPI
jgi:steroid delta-isomerase-like uncharacterized protein